MTKRLGTLLAILVLATAFLGSAANAAVSSIDTMSIAAVPSDAAQTVSEEGDPDGRDAGFHRRFCLRLNAVLSRLVDNGVITREQKLRILDAFNCIPERPSTDRPSTTRPTALRSAAVR